MACTELFYLSDDKILKTSFFDIQELEKGQSIYEVIKIIEGKTLFIQKHIVRLHNSASLINKKIWLTDKIIIEKVNKIIKINKVKTGRLKFVFRFYKNQDKFISFFLNKIEPSKKAYIEGIKIITTKTERSTPNIKIINYSLRSYIKTLIKEKDAFEALLINKLGNITECSKSNFFLIKKNIVYTPPAKNILPGITREYIFRICSGLGIKIVEKTIKQSELKKFDSAFISGTSIGVLPVSMIDNINFAVTNGILEKISNQYQKIIDEYLNSRQFI